MSSTDHDGHTISKAFELLLRERCPMRPVSAVRSKWAVSAAFMEGEDVWRMNLGEGWAWPGGSLGWGEGLGSTARTAYNDEHCVGRPFCLHFLG